jgi:hypothetical protein
MINWVVERLIIFSNKRKSRSTLCKSNPKGKYKIEYRATRTPDKCEDMIRYHKRSKHPLPTGHTLCEPYFKIYASGLVTEESAVNISMSISRKRGNP